MSTIIHPPVAAQCLYNRRTKAPPMIPPLRWRQLMTEILIETRHIHNNEYEFDCPLKRMMRMHMKQNIARLKLTCKERKLQVGGKKWELIARIMAKTVYGVTVKNWDEERLGLHQKVYDLSVMVAYHAGPWSPTELADGATVPYLNWSDCVRDEYAPRVYALPDSHMLATYGVDPPLCHVGYTRYYCGNNLACIR